MENLFCRTLLRSFGTEAARTFQKLEELLRQHTDLKEKRRNDLERLIETLTKGKELNENFLVQVNERAKNLNKVGNDSFLGGVEGV